MVEILTYLASHLSFLFVPSGYRFVDSSVEESFGGDAMVVLESTFLRLRVTWDRAQLLMDFQPVEGRSDEWFSPGLLQGLLTGERPRSELLDEEWGRFLASALPALEKRLSDPELVDETIKGLRKQAKIRAKELFG